MLEIIKTIKNNGKSAYSDACIEWVRSRFDKNENYLKYIELYENLG